METVKVAWMCLGILGYGLLLANLIKLIRKRIRLNKPVPDMDCKRIKDIFACDNIIINGERVNKINSGDDNDPWQKLGFKHIDKNGRVLDDGFEFIKKTFEDLHNSSFITTEIFIRAMEEDLDNELTANYQHKEPTKE
jgi:hypothetical protein